MGRFFFLGLSLLAFLFVLMMILLMLIYYCMAGVIQSKSGRRAEVDAIMNQGRLMNLMSYIPYSKFMMDGERDCPICLI